MTAKPPPWALKYVWRPGELRKVPPAEAERLKREVDDRVMRTPSNKPGKRQ